MTLPYQCLVSSTRASGESYEWILFGTAGPRLVAQSSTGASSAWTVEVAELPVCDGKIKFGCVSM